MPPKSNKLKRKEKKLAQKEFTDREQPQASFQNALKNVQNKECSILNFYGVGGIGKSSLQKHLINHHLKNQESTIYTWVDFDLPFYRNSHSGLKEICKNFKSNFEDIKFVTFDIAYTVYRSKKDPDMTIKDRKLPFLDEGSMVAGVFENMVDYTGGWVSLALNVTNYMYEKYGKSVFSQDIKDDLKSLNSMEHYEIIDELYKFFAYDLSKYIKDKHIDNCVFFFDTYEALWEDKRTKENEYDKDEWIRELILSMYELDLKPLYVISGREKLIWDKHERDWETDIEQHILGGLSDIDSKSFLKSCDIEKEDIQEAIIEMSKDDTGGCLPFYLDLCVDIYSNLTNPTIEDFKLDNKHDKIYDKFFKMFSEGERVVKYNKDELILLQLLSNARFFDIELFRAIIEKFKLNYSGHSLQEITKYSFVFKNDDKTYSLHNLIQDALKKELLKNDKALSDEIKEFLFEYYNAFLQDIDIKKISKNQKLFFCEAYFYKRIISTKDDFYNWFEKLYFTLFEAGEYIFLEKYVISNISFLNIKSNFLSDEYNRLGVIYHNLDRYELAVNFYKRALALRNNEYKENDIKIAQSYNNIALLYHNNKNYIEALSYYKKAIIAKEYNNKNYLSLAKTYSNYARLMRDMNQYHNSINYYMKSISLYTTNNDINKNYAADLSRLGTVYQNSNNCKLALYYLKKGLNIIVELAGEEHPYTATCFKNLGLFYNKYRKYKKANNCFIKSYEIRKTKLGENHRKTLEVKGYLTDEVFTKEK